MAAAASPISRTIPLFRLRLFLLTNTHINNHHRINSTSTSTSTNIIGLCYPLRRPICTTPPALTPVEPSPEETTARAVEIVRLQDEPCYRQWRDKEDEILRDVQPVITRVKDILHTDRYYDGERISDKEDIAAVEKLLAYHPHSEDKIGCGKDFLMVDRHPLFRNSRCLFVVRIDGAWIDFSYQKCLREYLRRKYPMHAERFIREHLKRGGTR